MPQFVREKWNYFVKIIVNDLQRRQGQKKLCLSVKMIDTSPALLNLKIAELFYEKYWGKSPYMARRNSHKQKNQFHD